MSRTKGSRNKPKDKPLTVAEPKKVTVVQPVETEEIDTEVAGKPFRGIRQRKIAEQLAFLFEEIKLLRDYIRRIEDARVPTPPTTLTPERAETFKALRKRK